MKAIESLLLVQWSLDFQGMYIYNIYLCLFFFVCVCVFPCCFWPEWPCTPTRRPCFNCAPPRLLFFVFSHLLGAQRCQRYRPVTRDLYNGFMCWSSRRVKVVLPSGIQNSSPGMFRVYGHNTPGTYGEETYLSTCDNWCRIIVNSSLQGVFS